MDSNAQTARHFADEWLSAWNSHDLDRILAHYSDDVEMHSPVIRQIMGAAEGVLRGKPAVRDYWSRALARNPTLHFELITVLGGVDSVVIHYRGHRGLSAEVCLFNGQGRVHRAYAHYATAVV